MTTYKTINQLSFIKVAKFNYWLNFIQNLDSIDSNFKRYFYLKYSSFNLPRQ